MTKESMQLIMLPDWACTTLSEKYVLSALGGKEKLQREAIMDMCNYYGIAL